MTIPFRAAYIHEDAIQALNTLLRSNRFDVDHGPTSTLFEQNISSLVGSRFAVSTNSCTAALHLALLAANIGPGDEVITSPLTYIASNLAIHYVGATPVFADIREDDLTLDPEDIKRKISYKTKAILPIHFGGIPCEMNEIMQIAKERFLFVIEDAANSFGALYNGKAAGALGDLGCFSFNAFKTLPTPTGGGMVVTNNPDYAYRIRKLSHYGFHPFHDGNVYKKYAVNEAGMKYYMNETTATIALAHLPHHQTLLERRKQITDRYYSELRNVPGLTLLTRPSHKQSSWYWFLVKVENRAAFEDSMLSSGIETYSAFPIVRNDLCPIFGGKRQDLPVLNRIEHSLVCIPLHNRLTDDDVSRVIEAIKKGW